MSLPASGKAAKEVDHNVTVGQVSPPFFANSSLIHTFKPFVKLAVIFLQYAQTNSAVVPPEIIAVNSTDVSTAVNTAELSPASLTADFGAAVNITDNVLPPMRGDSFNKPIGELWKKSLDDWNEMMKTMVDRDSM